MKRYSVSLLGSAFVILCCLNVKAESQYQGFVIQQAGKLLANPPLFFYEFQRNMETTTPLPPGCNFGLNYHFLGGILVLPLPDVTTAGNISAKFRLHPEGRLLPGLPQFDFVAGTWKFFPSSLIENKDATAADTQTKVTRADLGGSYAALVMTSSLEPRIRLFWSYKYSRLNLNITLNKEQDILGSKVGSFQGGLNEHTLAAGLEHTYGENRRWIIEGGYGLKNDLLSARVLWSRKFVDFGLSIYPESVFVMQPELNFHVNF